MSRSISRAARGRTVLAVVVLVAAGGTMARSTGSPSPPPIAITAAPEPAATVTGGLVTVESVTDGDTIVVSGGVRVRLIGVDTPETRHPDGGVECFGAEASALTTELLSVGEPVRLVHDAARLDRYGRTLAYVYRSSDDLFVNAALVEQGYARAGTYPPNLAHDAEFRRLESEARAGGRGLWSACPADAHATAPNCCIGPGARSGQTNWRDPSSRPTNTGSTGAPTASAARSPGGERPHSNAARG